MMLSILSYLVFPVLILAHPRERQQRHSHVRRHDWKDVALPPSVTGVFSAIDTPPFIQNSTDPASNNVLGTGSIFPQSMFWPASSSAESTNRPVSSSASVTNGQTFTLPTIASPSTVVNTRSAAAITDTSLAVTGTSIVLTSISMPAALRSVHSSTSLVTSVTTSSLISSAAIAAVSPAGFFQQPSPVSIVGQSAPLSINSSGLVSSAATDIATSSAILSTTSNPTTFSASASSAAGSVSPGASSGKKGILYNDATLTFAFANSGMSWAYNWASDSAGSLPSGVSYVPMLWGLASIPDWSNAAQSAIRAGSTAALSFNEPDLSSQSNIDPATAASLHIQHMNPLLVEVGSPAISNGVGTSPPLGIDWLKEFFTACAGQCKVDFVAFHWYSDASQSNDFMQHVTDVVAVATSNGVNKVWLTEFGTTGGDTATFLANVMPFLESTTAVDRYAFFKCADPQSLTGTSLNSVGTIYAETF